MASKESFYKSNGQMPGVCGIYNHGNTCFASAVIQCLSNTELFAEQLVTRDYRQDLGEVEKTSIKCPVTEKLAQLITSLWTGRYNEQISENFMFMISEQFNSFANFKQSDAHEFLLWLLNCVNDELNGRVDETAQVSLKSPAKTPTNTCNRTSNIDADVTDTNVSSSINLSENGVVSRLFKGQLRSTLSCPACYENSSTNEPYLFLPLHIPEPRRFPVHVTVVRSCPQNAPPVKVAVIVSEFDTVRILREKLAATIDVKVAEVVLISIDPSCGFGKTFGDEIQLCQLKSELLFLHAVQLAIDNWSFSESSEYIFVVAVNWIKTKDKIKMFGVPLVMSVITQLNVHNLQVTLVHAMTHLLHKNALKKVLESEKPSELFRINVVNDVLDSWAMPDGDEDLPFEEDFVLSAYSSMCDGPLYLRLNLEWTERASTCIGRSSRSSTSNRKSRVG